MLCATSIVLSNDTDPSVRVGDEPANATATDQEIDLFQRRGRIVAKRRRCQRLPACRCGCILINGVFTFFVLVYIAWLPG